MGRNRLPPHVVHLVKRYAAIPYDGLTGKPLTSCEIHRRLERDGVEISYVSVFRVLRGAWPSKSESTSRLAPGETKLAEAVRCPRGHTVNVVPCRQCACEAAIAAGRLAG